MKGGSRGSRLPTLVAILGVIVAVGAWQMFGGGDNRALNAVRAHIDPAIDAQRPLGEVFGSHPHLLRPEWIGAWGGNRTCAAVVLHAESLADVEAACPGLLDPLRGLVARDPRWVGLAPDQPLAIQLVFQVEGEGSEARISAFQVLATEAWVVYKPECVAAYEETLEGSIRSSDNASRARRYRLRHEGDRALFDVGLNSPLLAGAGLTPPLKAVQRIVAWR